jgi:hypothetical protein
MVIYKTFTGPGKEGGGQLFKTHRTIQNETGLRAWDEYLNGKPGATVKRRV